MESLQQVIYQGEGNEISLMEKIEEKENQNDKVLNRMVLEEVIGKLDGKDREFIYKRYVQEKTQTIIGQEMGISQVQVSRQEKRIMKILRSKMQE